ncbi:MAG: acetyl-CoA hydrolase/transferase C-terminal domain-containing protein, partial [Anaerovorax sp.]
IGAIPDAVLQSLKDKKDLGIHSEMISDGVVDLYEAGVVNCAKKGLDPGKMVVAFLMGTKRLYDFAANNPIVELRTVDYVNHPRVVAQCTNLVCINACIAVDFMGQVVSDSIGIKQFSGVGGQVDFCRGAAMSLDGKAKNIIAMPSVANKKDGSKISKITPYIDEGAAITTSRQDVHYIVTEYGIALLKGKNLKDRARALINIAHPDFREELKAQFVKRFNAEF